MFRGESPSIGTTFGKRRPEWKFRSVILRPSQVRLTQTAQVRDAESSVRPSPLSRQARKHEAEKQSQHCQDAAQLDPSEPGTRNISRITDFG